MEDLFALFGILTITALIIFGIVGITQGIKSQDSHETACLILERKAENAGTVIEAINLNQQVSNEIARGNCK